MTRAFRSLRNACSSDSDPADGAQNHAIFRYALVAHTLPTCSLGRGAPFGTLAATRDTSTDAWCSPHAQGRPRCAPPRARSATTDDPTYLWW